MKAWKGHYGLTTGADLIAPNMTLTRMVIALRSEYPRC